MSGIYISGMDMPSFEHQSWDVRHGTDGKWYVVDTNAETSDGEWHEIIPVPPHGRLIDADALSDMLNKYKREYALEAGDKKDFGIMQKAFGLRDAELMAESLPTILPAEEGET